MARERILDSGEGMLVVEFGKTVDVALNERVLALDAALTAAHLPGVLETTPTIRSLAIDYDPLVIDRAKLVAVVEELSLNPEITARRAKTWVFPICYEPPFAEDLTEAASLLGMDAASLVELHASAIYRVLMYGFSPGFVYLGGLPAQLDIPRRERPRAPHPPNAVMIAGGMSVIAGFSMPTGWWVIGRTPERMFAPGRTPEFLIDVGDEIRFDRVSADDFTALEARAESGEIVAKVLV